jgi:hypothetical protein
MRKLFALLVLGMVLAAARGAPDAGAQAALDKVPRPVYFAPAQVDGSLGKEGSTLIAGTPEMLSTSIAALQTFDRVDAVGRARSVVTVSSTPDAGGKVIVTIQLLEAGVVKNKTAQSFAAASLDLSAFRTFIDQTAALFAPSLDPVTPESDVLKVSAQKELVQAAKETDYLDTLDKRWEFTLWTTGLLRLLDSTGVNANQAYYFGLDVFPLILEADWFFGRNLGLQFSFYVHSTNAFDFGNNSRHNAFGLFLFPGIGIIYRTLGEISAEYALTVSVGGIYLSATQGDVRDQSGAVVLPQGSSMWSNFSVKLRIAPTLVWSITPTTALKAGLGFDIVFPGMFSWYRDSPLADFQYLCIGAAYKI